MNVIVHGVLNGRMIELDEDVALATGDAVTVIVRTAPAISQENGGHKSCAGILADIPGLDEDLAEVQAWTRSSKWRSVPE
jgi:hypothetical protein